MAVESAHLFISGPQNQPLGPGEQPVQEAGQPQSDGPPPTPTEAERPFLLRKDGKWAIAMSESLECSRRAQVPPFWTQEEYLPARKVILAQHWPEDPFGHENGAIAVLDFNNDGWDDIVTAMATGISVLNNAEGFNRTDWFATEREHHLIGSQRLRQWWPKDLYITQFMANDILLHNTGAI